MLPEASVVYSRFEIRRRDVATRGRKSESVVSPACSRAGRPRDMLKTSLGLGHGDANALGLAYKKTLEAPQPESNDVLDDIYVGPKAGLRAIHERLMTEIAGLGAFEIAPKKGYVSLRRKKQFAMVGPGTKQRLEVGLNMKGVEAGDRLQEVPA